MHPIAIIDFFTILVLLVAAIRVIWGWKRPRLAPEIPILFLLLIGLMLLYATALFLEWSGFLPNVNWHFLEDIAGVFIPFTWAFAFYVINKNEIVDELEASRAHFRNLVESTSDWIWEVDTQGRYTYASPRVERILGYTPDELIGKSPFDQMPPDEAERVRAMFAEFVEKKSSFQHLENLNLHKDGREVFLETNGTPIFDRQGKLVGYRGVDRDVTVRKMAERLTARRQEELDSVFRASPAGIAMMRDRKLIHANARFFEITGYPEDELTGMDVRPCYLTDQDYQAVGEKYTQALAEGSARIETRWVRKDRAIIDVIIYLAPLDRADASKGFAVVLQDVTELTTARQQVMAEKSRAQLYLDVAGVMIVVLDAMGQVQLLNKRSCQILGCTPEQAIGLDWFSTFLPNAYKQITRNVFDRIISGQEKSLEYFENPVRAMDGSEKLIAWHNVVLRNESGRITGLISSGEDITGARAAEKAVRQSDERLRLALSAAQMGTWRWDVVEDQDVRDANLNAILGLPAEETTQSKGDFFECVHPDDRQAARDECNRAICDRDACQVQFRIVRPDGQVRWVRDYGRPFYDFNGKLEYMTGVVVDITEHQQAQQALKKSEQRYAMAQTVANIGSWDWDIQTGHLEWSEQIEPIFGLAAGQFKGTYEAFMECIHPQDRQSVLDSVNATIEKDQEYDIEHRIVWPDGTVRWVSETGDVFRDGSGKAVRMLGVVQDITERKKAEGELHASRDSLEREIKRFENMFHTIPDAIYIKDLDSRFIHVNEGWLQKAGLRQEQEAVGKTDFDIFTDEHARPAYDDEQQIMRTGVPKIGYEEKETWPDGRVTWCLSTKMPLRDVDGNITGLIGISHDVTDRKKAEEVIHESEQRYRNFIRLSGEGIARFEFKQPMSIHLPLEEQVQWIAEKGILAECNDLFARMYGYKNAEEFVGARIYALWNNRDVAEEVVSQLIRDGYQWTNIETHEMTQEGVEKYFLNNMVSIIEDDYLKSQWLTQIDITEEVRNRQALQFTQFAMDHVGEAAYWTKSNAKFFYVNEAACRSLGYTRDELLQMSIFDIDPDLVPERWEAIWNYVRTHGTHQIESRHRTKDGRIFPVEINGNFVVYDGSEYSIAFTRDITERKIAEEQRQMMNQRLTERNDELQSIVFTTAHDLRSPLVNIIGFTGELEKSLDRLAQLLKGAPLSEDIARQIDYLFKTDIPESLNFIRSGNHRMDMLLNGILRLSRVGSAVLKTEPIDMNDLVETVLKDLRYRMSMLDLDVSVGPDLPDCTGDFSLLSQVFMNLLDNAIKYRRPDRRAVIEIGGVVKKDYVEYRVADNGIGIAPEHQEKVFELFHRLDTSKDDQDGEGLGLTIVRRILDRLGGTVRIDSTPGLGTTIYVCLPKV